MRKFKSEIMSILRRVAGMQSHAESNDHHNDAAVLAETMAMSPEELLAIGRLRYFKSQLNTEPRALVALLKHEADWAGSWYHVAGGLQVAAKTPSRRNAEDKLRGRSGCLDN